MTELVRFILTMRNVNVWDGHQPKDVTICFILTMRNVNLKKKLAIFSAVLVLY